VPAPMHTSVEPCLYATNRLSKYQTVQLHYFDPVFIREQMDRKAAGTDSDLFGPSIRLEEGGRIDLTDLMTGNTSGNTGKSSRVKSDNELDINAVTRSVDGLAQAMEASHMYHDSIVSGFYACVPALVHILPDLDVNEELGNKIIVRYVAWLMRQFWRWMEQMSQKLPYKSFDISDPTMDKLLEIRAAIRNEEMGRATWVFVF
jgi:hypothetical protein